MQHALLLHHEDNPSKLPNFTGWEEAAKSLGVHLHVCHTRTIDILIGKSQSIYIHHEKLPFTQALNLFYAGVDLLWDGRKWVVCEVNGTPGYAGLTQATDRPIQKLLIQSILNHLSKTQRQPEHEHKNLPRLPATANSHA